MITLENVHRGHPRHLELDRLLEIVRGEYLEMPGLRLTRRQAQRLWALDSDTCDALLETLEAAGFLRRTRGGDYMLAFPH
jgi:hypothetical protein